MNNPHLVLVQPAGLEAYLEAVIGASDGYVMLAHKPVKGHGMSRRPPAFE